MALIQRNIKNIDNQQKQDIKISLKSAAKKISEQWQATKEINNIQWKVLKYTIGVCTIFKCKEIVQADQLWP